MEQHKTTGGTTGEQQIGATQWSGGGTTTLERPQTFADARQYATKAREILTDKSGAAGFDPSTTAVGALLLGFEALISALDQQGAAAWDGNATAGGKT